ncbi:MAG: 16S rRNA (uracil(1498)-N(3))-methyltransferase [Bacteroidetes bacterium]|nr:16S rRNA (uracil(1498)-N(3))-methyltransferase [Bacteroidota bacterium]
MQTFFCQIEDASKARLNDEETRHLKVLRIKESDRIRCVDGHGTISECQVIKIGKDFTELEILNSVKVSGFRKFKLHLYVAPTKNAERTEWLLEKAIETGLDSITFIETEHTEKHRVNLARLQRIAVSALKQSGQSHLPVIRELLRLNDLTNLNGTKLFAHCASGKKIKLSEVFLNKPPQDDIHVFIGPEGDFSKNEIDRFYSLGFNAISLGESRLRTETAALYTVMVINALA